jgi:hypothetical protein
MTEEVKSIIKGITAQNLIIDMIDAIKNPIIGLNMERFYYYDDAKERYFGCAAANYIIKKFGPHIINENQIDNRHVRSDLLGISETDLQTIEYSLNYLRCGLIKMYNNIKLKEFPEIKIFTNINLPVLHNKWTEEELEEYRKLAEFQTK